MKSNSLFLERLFSQEAGRWIEIESLSNGIEAIRTQFEELRELFQGTLRVTWLDYPNATVGKGYCLIVFFVEELFWSHLALYNKQLFLNEFIHEQLTVDS